MSNKSKETLQEIQELIQEHFPKISVKSITKIIYTIKARSERFARVWFSRLEASSFWIWETTLQRIIDFLREFWLLEYQWRVLRKKWVHYCNVYTISEDFKNLFKELEFFVKKTFRYIDPIIFMKRFFQYKKVSTHRYVFKANWNRYIINLTWRFKWVIYWVEENKIINPYELLT